MATNSKLDLSSLPGKDTATLDLSSLPMKDEGLSLSSLPSKSAKISPLDFFHPIKGAALQQVIINKAFPRYGAFQQGVQRGALGIKPVDEELANKYPGATFGGEVTGNVLPYLVPTAKAATTVLKFGAIPAIQEAERQATTPEEQLSMPIRAAKVATAGLTGAAIGKFFQFGDLGKTIVQRALMRAVPTGVLSSTEALVQQGLSGADTPDKVAALQAGGMSALTTGILSGLAEIPGLRTAIMDEGLRIARQKAGFLEPRPTKITFEEAKKLVAEQHGNVENLSPVLQRAVHEAKKEAAISDFVQRNKEMGNDVSRKIAAQVMGAQGYRQSLSALDETIFKLVRRTTGRKPFFSWHRGLDYELDFSKMSPEAAQEVSKLMALRKVLREGRDPINGYLLDKLQTRTAMVSKQEFKNKFNVPLEETQGLLKGDIEHLTPQGIEQIRIPGYSGTIRIQARQIANNNIILKDDKGNPVKFTELPATSRKLIETKLSEALMVPGTNPLELGQVAQKMAEDFHQPNCMIFEGTGGKVSPDTKVYWGLHNKRYDLKELAGLLRQGDMYVDAAGNTQRQSIPPDSWDIKYGLAKGQEPKVEEIRALLSELYYKSGHIESLPKPASIASIVPGIAIQEPQKPLLPQPQGEAIVPETTEATPAMPEEALPKEQPVEQGVEELFQHKAPVKVDLEGNVIHGTTLDNMKNYLQALKDMEESMTSRKSKASVEERIGILRDKLSPRKSLRMVKDRKTGELKKSGGKGLVLRHQESIESLEHLKELIVTLKNSTDLRDQQKLNTVVAQANWIMNPWNPNSPERLKKQIESHIAEIKELERIANEMNTATLNEGEAIQKIYADELNAIKEKMSPSELALIQGKNAEELARIISEIENQGTYKVRDTIKETMQREAKELLEEGEVVSMNDTVEEITQEGMGETLEKDADLPVLEEGEEFVEHYDDVLGERVVDKITLTNAEVVDINGNVQTLSGEFFYTNVTKTEVTLVSKQNKVTITKDGLRRLLKSASVEIGFLRIRSETGSALNPIEIARSFFNLFRPVDQSGKEVKMTNEFGKPDVHIKEAVLAQRFLLTPSEFKKWMQTKLGEKAQDLKKVTGPVPLQDEVITQIADEPDYKRYAQNIAKSNVYLLQKTLFDQVMKDVGKKQIAQVKYQLIVKWMCRASEEIRVVMDYNDYVDGKLRWEKSEIGIGGAHHPSDDKEFPDAERDTYIADMVQIHKDFGVPLPQGMTVEQYTQTLMAARLPMSFTTLLSAPQVCSDQNLVLRMMVYDKTENKTGVMLDALELGAFENSDMFDNISKGYEHRIYAMMEQQQPGRRRARTQVQTPTVPNARYRTFSEFSWQTNRKGMKAIEDYFSNSIDYIADYMMLNQQIRNINLLKTKINLNPKSIVGFEDNADVKKLMQRLHIVEFSNSEVIQELKNITKLDEQALLQQLGYIQDKNAPGLRQRFRDSFHPPYVTRELYDFLQAVYAPRSLSKVNRFFNYPKVFITMAPVDSIWRFMTAVVVEGIHHPQELAKLPFEFASATINGLTNIGPKILAGEYNPNEVFESEDYGELGDFLRLGGTVHFAQAMEGFFDVQQLGNIPQLNSFKENAYEYYKSWLGINTAVFQHFILRKVYSTWKVAYRRMMDENPSMDKETAMRLTAKVINNLSAMLSSSIFGDKANAFNLILFSRSLTVSLLRTISATMYPVLKDTGLYKYHTGEGGGILGPRSLNPLFWGETSPRDMEKVSIEMMRFVFALMILSWTVNSAIQYALSFLDDPNELDEYGELAVNKDGTLNLLAKRRFMMLNEGWKFWSPRLPWRDWNNHRLYLDLQILKEIPETIRILTGPDSWLRNKLNWVMRVTAEWVTNRDSKGNLIRDNNLGVEEYSQRIQEWIKANTTIIQFKPQAGVVDKTGKRDEAINNILFLTSFFGAGTTTGEAVESGRTWKEAVENRRKVARELFKKQQNLTNNPPDQMPPDELFDRIDENFAPGSAKNLWFKKNFPVADFEKKHKKEIYR